MAQLTLLQRGVLVRLRGQSESVTNILAATWRAGVPVQSESLAELTAGLQSELVADIQRANGHAGKTR